MNLAKIRASFAAIAAAIAYLVAPSASAAILATNNFETACDGFTVDIGTIEEAAAITAYGTYPSRTAPYPFSGTGSEGFGSNYLAVDTGDATIFRELAAQTSSTYLDTFMQFEPTAGEISYTNAAKIVVYLDAATSNLCVISGTSANDRTPITNRLTSAGRVAPGTWGRLTINALKTSSDSVFSFNVRLNGTKLTNGTTDTFYSLTASNAVSRVGFKGTGALDDLVARTSDPFGTAAKIGEETYGSLANAIAEAGADDVVILQSNNAENITLAEGQTFKLKIPNGVTYSGKVYSASGYKLEISDPDENGVVTYSQAPYKPSININFTHEGSGLTTSADVGLAGYEVPGTSWNNFAGANGTYSTVNAVDATGAASTEAGVSVVVSGSRGSYSCSSLTAASNPLQGYIDENDSNMTPTVTVTGIPYYKYRVVVYHSTDTGNVPFGYDTINGTNYTYVSDALVEGTTAWGASGAANSANAISEGGNVLLTGELSGSTLTVIGHRGGGASNARGCIAAIQIIEVRPEAGENDLIIEVSGDTTYTVSESKVLLGTVYVIGNGTLTLAGSAKINAATIYVGAGVALNPNTDRLDSGTFSGAGAVVYDGGLPTVNKGWTESAWIGAVWIKNQAISQFEGNVYGNANSTIRFTGVTGFLQSNTYGNKGYVHTVPLELVDEGDTVAFTYNNGWSGYLVKINTLKGSGTLKITDAGLGEHIYIGDGSGFAGVLNLTGKYVYMGGSAPDSSLPTANPNGKLEIREGATATVSSGKTWTANGGFVVDGTLNIKGTLASSLTPAAISGSGTVVFHEQTPSHTESWTNSAWTGTVTISNHTLPNNWLLSNYGNSGSKVCLDGVSGPLKFGNADHNVGELIIAAGGYTHTGQYSSGEVSFTIPCKVTGNGTYKMNSTGAASKTTFFTGDMSEFSGALAFGDDHSRFVIGTTSRDFIARSIVVGAGKSFAVASDWSSVNLTGGIFVDRSATFAVRSNGYVNPSGGLTIDGTATASGKRRAWGCIGPDASVVINESGVLELTSTGNVNDSSFGTDPTSADFSKVTGTGTIKYSSTAGWRAFPSDDAKMPAETLTIQVELYDSLILPTKPNGETVVGCLAGSKNIRSDFGTTSESRILTVTQSKDTEWSGTFFANRISQFNVVAPAEGTPGTLTLSGTQSANIPMQVDGKVNLTGTWVGAVTVAGTLGGTGTINGNVTLSDGATLKVNDISDLLSVTGLTINGTVNIDLPEGTAFNTNTKFLTTSNKPTINDGAKFNVSVGGVRKAVKVSATNDGLRLSLAPIVFLL